MHKITGFTTKKDIGKQFADAGVPIILGFNKIERLIVKKNPFKKVKCLDKEGKEVVIIQGKEIINNEGIKELVAMSSEEIAEAELAEEEAAKLANELGVEI